MPDEQNAAMPVAEQQRGSQPARGGNPADTKPAAREVDPKVADAYQRMVLAAMKVVYEPTIAPKLIEMMRGGEQPAAGLARAAGLVAGQLQEKAKNAPQGVIQTVIPVIVAFLMELADAAGLFKMDQKLMQQAIALAMRQGGGAAPAPQQQAPAASGPGLVDQAMAEEA